MSANPKKPKTIASALPSVDDLDVPEPPGGWDAYDAKVAAGIARERKAEAHTARLERVKQLREASFPAISLDAAFEAGSSKSLPTTSLKHAGSFMAGSKAVLVLAGGTGAGKTTAAAWCALEAGGSSAGFIRASELEARGRYDRDLRTWLRERSLLVIDDLGVEVLDGKGVFRSLLDETIDMFYGNRKRVVITTNLSKADAIERYGDRVMSRLHEVGAWGDCGAVDLRRTK